MKRAVVIGNSGGGKSTLARRLSSAWKCDHVEIDALLWQQGWPLVPADIYNAEHARLIAGEGWIMDGLGRLESIPARLARATDIVLIDMPLWMHFWLAAERQIRWSAGMIENPPAGLAKMPPTETLFRTIWRSTKTAGRKFAGSWRSKRNKGSGFSGSDRFPISMDSEACRDAWGWERAALSARPFPGCCAALSARSRASSTRYGVAPDQRAPLRAASHPGHEHVTT
jgi:adenylate kinase family enzyme